MKKASTTRFAFLASAASALALSLAGCTTADTEEGDELDGVAEQDVRAGDHGTPGERLDVAEIDEDCSAGHGCEDETACDPGKLSASLCNGEQAPDVVLRAALEPPSTRAATSNAQQASATCDDFVVRWSNPEQARWWDRLVAFVPIEARPDTACACENLELVVEVEEIACVTEGCISGTCTDGGMCCNSSECGEGEACIGATPLTGSLCGPAAAKRVASGKFLPGFGCVLSLTVERDDAQMGLAFRGIAPHVRAQAIDKLSGARYPVTIAGHND
jgi:hypothetical protein